MKGSNTSLVQEVCSEMPLLKISRLFMVEYQTYLLHSADSSLTLIATTLAIIYPE